MKAILYEFLDLYKTSIVFIIAITAFTLQVVVFNDPPSFPLSNENEDPIDCFNIISSSITIERSRLKVRMTVKDFIQYPIEVASSMVHIESKVGNVSFSFPFNTFWDLESDLHHISFCTLQTAAGDVEASLFCQRTLLSKTKNKIQSLDAYPVGWSRMFEDNYFSGHFTDICFNSDLKLVFCSKQKAEIGKIHTSWSEEVPVFITSNSASYYQQSEKIPNLENFSIYIPSNSKISNAQDFLFNILLPLMGSLSFDPNTFVVSNKNIYEELKPILGSKIQLLSKSCYRKLVFLPSTGGYNILTEKKYDNYAQAISIHSNFIFNLGKSVFDRLKEFYPEQDESDQKYDIVFDQGSSQFINAVKNSLPSSYNIFEINNNQSFSTISSIIKTAKVVVASDIRSLFFGALMNNESTLIEVPPDGLSCISFKDYISEKLDPHYKVLKIKNKRCACNSKNLTCYFSHDHKYNHVDSTELSDLIQDSLN